MSELSILELETEHAELLPEQAKELGISEEDVIKRVMLGGTVDGIFTTTMPLGEAAKGYATAESRSGDDVKILLTP